MPRAHAEAAFSRSTFLIKNKPLASSTESTASPSAQSFSRWSKVNQQRCSISGVDMVDQMFDAWRTNNRINFFLLARISDECLRCSLSKRGGLDVARQFAHMHDIRVWALQTRAKDLAKGLEVFASKESPHRDTLKSALSTSCDAIGLFLADLIAGKPKRRGSKKGWVSHLSYFIAHESHHRGSIILT